MDPISPSEIVHYKAEHNRLLKNLPSMEGQYCLDTRNSQCGDKTVRITRGRVKRVCVERNKSHLEQALCIKIVLPFLQLKWNFNWFFCSAGGRHIRLSPLGMKRMKKSIDFDSLHPTETTCTMRRWVQSISHSQKGPHTTCYWKRLHHYLKSRKVKLLMRKTRGDWFLEEVKRKVKIDIERVQGKRFASQG